MYFNTTEKQIPRCKYGAEQPFFETSMFNCSLAHHFHQISWAVDFSDVLPCVIRRCLKYKNKKRSLVYFQHFDKCNMDLPTAQPSAFLSETISVHYDANVAPQHQKYQLQEIELHYNAYKQGQPLYFDLVLLLLIAITHTKNFRIQCLSSLD